VRRFARDVWLLTPAFAAHVAEEAPGFTRWARRHASEQYTQRDFVRNNALGLVGTVAATRIVARRNRGALTLAFYSAVLTQQALWNTAFHVGTTVAWRTYSPGLITSVTLFLPLWGHLTRLALREGRLTPRTAAGATVAAGLLHAVVVAQQVFFVRVPR
jgi:Protein of unknown function with HXXEE motif